MYRLISYLIIVCIVCGCKQRSTDSNKELTNAPETFQLHNPQATSLLGVPLNSPPPSEKLRKRWTEKAAKFREDPTDIDNIIWFGRFTAYMGNYKEAINIYTNGIELHPEDARLYRHRGHRYITLRQFEKAIDNFTKAKSLIEGQDNQVEPDGMPNAQNIPVSTLHGNIYYHLGLAHYLNGDMPRALTAYQACLETSERSDNVVSAAHWLYMILRKLERPEEADSILELVGEEMEIIENHSYYNLCLFYKGQLSEEELLDPEDSASANDAVKYGLANWYCYHDPSDKAKMEKGTRLKGTMIKSKSWASFGYIAAEADLYSATQ